MPTRPIRLTSPKRRTRAFTSIEAACAASRAGDVVNVPSGTWHVRTTAVTGTLRGAGMDKTFIKHRK